MNKLKIGSTGLLVRQSEQNVNIQYSTNSFNEQIYSIEGLLKEIEYERALRALNRLGVDTAPSRAYTYISHSTKCNKQIALIFFRLLYQSLLGVFFTITLLLGFEIW